VTDGCAVAYTALAVTILFYSLYVYVFVCSAANDKHIGIDYKCTADYTIIDIRHIMVV